MEKMPHPTDSHVWHHAPGRILLSQASGKLFQPLTAIWNVGPQLRRILQIENASSGYHTTWQDGISNITSLQPGPAVYPLKWGLVERVDGNPAKLPKCGLGAYSWCDRRVTFVHCALTSSIPSLSRFSVVGRQRLENELDLVQHWQPMILAGVVATHNAAVTQ
jgi:hypothetical protein